MTLARRIRDVRYAMGWGPDELARRAEISRTALYQIESGKTEFPRAATLQRIARALGVSIEVLLENVASSEESEHLRENRHPDRFAGRRAHLNGNGTHLESLSRDHSFEVDAHSRHRFHPIGDNSLEAMTTCTSSLGHSISGSRQRELAIKFEDLLDSPWSESVARIVEEAHTLLSAILDTSSRGL